MSHPRGKAKLTPEQVLFIRSQKPLREGGPKQSDLAEQFGVSQGHISIIRGAKYRGADGIQTLIAELGVAARALQARLLSAELAAEAGEVNEVKRRLRDRQAYVLYAQRGLQQLVGDGWPGEVDSGEVNSE